jgi:hypothetical protein
MFCFVTRVALERTYNAGLSIALLLWRLCSKTTFLANFTMLLHAALSGSLVWQPCLAALSGSIVWQPCLVALSGSLVRQLCPAALSGDLSGTLIWQPCLAA